MREAGTFAQVLGLGFDRETFPNGDRGAGEGLGLEFGQAWLAACGQTEGGGSSRCRLKLFQAI